MACTTCNAALRVDATEQTVIADGAFTRSVVPVAAKSGSRPQLECPICHTMRNALLNNGTSFFAVCLDDRQLMEVYASDWQAWLVRNGNDATTDGDVAA